MDDKSSFENRIFKLSTGERVNSDVIEHLIENSCHYVKYVVVNEDEKRNPIALIFPNKKLLENPDYQVTPEEGCFCPRNLNELGRCLTGCLNVVNQVVQDEGDRIKNVAIINKEIQIGESTNNTSLMDKYRSLLGKTYGQDIPGEEEIYMVKLGSK
ncbi:MAG: hypothetical protein ACHQK8_04790 [Bacteroidia bacterium]